MHLTSEKLIHVLLAGICRNGEDIVVDEMFFLESDS